MAMPAEPAHDEEPELPPVKVLTREEARAYFDAEARRMMGMSGEEFLRRLDSGEFDDIIDHPDHPQVGILEAIRSFAR